MSQPHTRRFLLQTFLAQALVQDAVLLVFLASLTVAAAITKAPLAFPMLAAAFFSQSHIAALGKRVASAVLEGDDAKAFRLEARIGRWAWTAVGLMLCATACVTLASSR